MSQKPLFKQVLFGRIQRYIWLCLFLVVFSFLSTIFNQPQKVEAATSNTMNFQARLMQSSGALVPDGYYNVEFKLWDASTGGTNEWTETYKQTNRVRVANGYLTVNLGALTGFSGSINWDQEHWLTMNIGGTTNTASPSWDGEMTPRLKLTAVPYAFTAGKLQQTNGGNTSTLGFATQTGSRSILLPDESGTVCLQASANCGFVTGSAANYIQNGTSPQTANFNVTGNGVIGGSLDVNDGIDVENGFSLQGPGTADVDAVRLFEDGSTGYLYLQHGAGGGILMRDEGANVIAQFNGTSGLVINTGGILLEDQGINFNNDTNLYRLSANTLATDDALSVGGNFAVNTNKFQVNATTGNTSVGGTLNVTGSTTFNGATNTFQQSVGSANDTVYLQAASGQTGNLLNAYDVDGDHSIAITKNAAIRAESNIGSTTVFSSTSGNQDMFKISANGTLAWGGGFDPTDVSLSRSNNKTLKVGGSFLIQPAVIDSQTALQVLNVAGDNVFNVDTTTGVTTVSGGLNVNNGFTLKSAGTDDVDAVRLFENAGSLYLQHGLGGDIVLRDETAGVIAVFNDEGLEIGMGGITLANSGTTPDKGITMGDTNLYRSAADVLQTDDSFHVQVNSGDALQINNASGSALLTADTNNMRIGIGTDTPRAQLHVVGSGANGSQARIALGDYCHESIPEAGCVSGANIFLGEYGTGDSDRLQIQGREGFTFTTGASANKEVLYIDEDGSVEFQGNANSTHAFLISDADGMQYLRTDSVTKNIYVGYDMLSIDTDEADDSGGYVINNGAASAGNEIPNSSFESDIESMDKRSGYYSTTGSIDSAGSNAHTGYKSLRVPAAGSFVGAGVAKTFDVTEGEQLYFRGWVKTSSGTNGQGGYFAACYDKDWNNATYFNSDWTNPGTSWALRSISISIPAGCAHMTLSVTVRDNSTTGNWYFDDLYLARTGQEAPSLFKNAANSTTAFQIQRSNGDNILTADTTNTRVLIGSATTPSLSSAQLVATVAEIQTTLRVGSGGNGFSFNDAGMGDAGKFRLYGTARNTKKITLTPEFAGAVLNGTGSGSMTAGYDGTAKKNYYKWTSTQTSNQSYEVVLQVALPSDWNGWASSNPITADAWTSSTANTAMTATVLDTAGATDTGLNAVSILPGSNNTWTTASGATFSGTYTADGIVTIRINMTAKNSANLQLGNITLAYLSSF